MRHNSLRLMTTLAAISMALLPRAVYAQGPAGAAAQEPDPRVLIGVAIGVIVLTLAAGGALAFVIVFLSRYVPSAPALASAAAEAKQRAAPAAPQPLGTGNILFRLGLVRGFGAQIVGTGIGLAFVTGIRALMGLPPWKAEPAVVVGALFGAIAFLFGVGALSDWMKWALGEETPEHPAHDPAMPAWTRYFGVSLDHKVIGIQYGVTSLVMLVTAGTFALIFRTELARSGMQFLSTDLYNTLMGLHGIVMIAGILLGVGAMSNYLVPLMIGARDMAFPRLNAFAYWINVPGGVLVLSSLFLGGFDTGWTGYPPLSARAPLGMQMFFLGVYLIGLSFQMVMFQRLLGLGFFDPARGGNPILFQHLFWFYSHPAVYVFVLPGLGIISELLPVFARKPLFGYRWIAMSSLGIAAVGFLVWAHHMFTSGMEEYLRVPFMYSTLLVAVPTGVKFFSWVGTLWRGKIQLDTPMLFALGAIVVFLFGGLTGPPNGTVATDLHLHDTYWVVAHFHNTMFGGFIFPFFAAIYYWFPKMTGRRMNETLGKIHFYLMVPAFWVLTFGMFWIGLLGMRRRIADYDPAQGFDNVHLVMTVATFLIAASILVFLINIVTSVWRGATATGNLWRSRSPEWLIPSPAPEHNYEQAFAVVGEPYDYGLPGSTYVNMSPATRIYD